MGANVRAYSVGSRDVFVSFAEDEIAPLYNAGILIPWPNRLRDGRYTVDGVECQVPVNEPERGTALHGLASWHRWTCLAKTDSSVQLCLELPASPGYPFQLRTVVEYSLSDKGLQVVVTTTNIGRTTAPYGIGFHPWLSSGGADLDECTYRLDAKTRVTTDDRLLPTGTEPVAGQYDLRTAVSLADHDLDDAFVDVIRDEAGLSWARLTGPDGKTAAIWMDETMDTWQACTGNHIQPERLRRCGVATEPMSCIADAFRTGDRLVRLAPGASHEVRWGAALL